MVQVRGYTEDDVDVLADGLIELIQASIARTIQRVAAQLNPALTAGDAFHLPGQHDQGRHGGHGGFQERIAAAKTGDEALGSTDVRFTGDTSIPHGEAIASYAGWGSEDTNSGLRQGRGRKESLDVEHRRIADELDRSMSSSTLHDDVVVYRGMNGRRAFGSEDWNDNPGSMVGAEFTDHAFSSTTTSPGIAKEFTYSQTPVRMRILAPRGTHAITIDQGESEILLDRGLKFRIVSDTRGSDGVREFDVEVAGSARE